MSFVKRYLNRRMLLELLPAAAFFVVNFGWGLMPATAAVMVATLGVTVVGLAVERRVPVLAAVTLALVLLLGGASLLLGDEVFIKVQPTVGNGLFAGALAVGLFFRPCLLARALGGQVTLTDAGWRILTALWIVFALCVAGVNEVVWRTMDTDTWVAVRTGLAPAAILGYIVITRVVAEFYWDEETVRGE